MPDRIGRAVAVAFLLNGFAYASWLARLPALRERLDLSSSGVGLLLVCLSLGTVIALPTAGLVVARFGTRNTVRGGAALVVVGLGLLSLAAAAGLPSLAALGMFVYGGGTSSWDVAMNVEGAAVERRAGRAVMPRFHAAFSLGTILGAATGALAAAQATPVTWQLLGTAAAVAIAVRPCTASFRNSPGDSSTEVSPRSALTAWREPRTLLIGFLVLSFALSEGLANDWLALTMVDAYGTSEATGAATFACFVTAMTLGRTFGGRAVDRWGPVATLRSTAALVIAGAAIVSLGSSPVAAVTGAVLWGVGASLGFPLGMTAAAEDEHRSSARVAVVSSIGYAAFLGGPPVMGLLADVTGLRQALLLALAAGAGGLLLAGAVDDRPHTGGQQGNKVCSGCRPNRKAPA
jgi:predicted MFS family arabinose efflux permease